MFHRVPRAGPVPPGAVCEVLPSEGALAWEGALMVSIFVRVNERTVCGMRAYLSPSVFPLLCQIATDGSWFESREEGLS